MLHLYISNQMTVEDLIYLDQFKISLMLVKMSIINKETALTLKMCRHQGWWHLKMASTKLNCSLQKLINYQQMCPSTSQKKVQPPNVFTPLTKRLTG